jgi:hypothetical protein
MESWAWLAVYVVAFGLLQLVLFRYFQRETSAETTPAASDRRRQSPPDPPTGTDDGVHCRHCGTVNERDGSVRFCRHCVGALQ